MPAALPPAGSGDLLAIQGAKELAAALRDIREGRPAAVYLVFGSEGYLVRTAAEALAKELASAAGAEIAGIDAEGRGVEFVLEPLNTLSLFASAQVTVVRNFAHLLSGEGGERLLAGVDTGLSEGSAIVFVAPGSAGGREGGGEARIDRRSKGYKGLAKRAVLVELNEQKPETLAVWLREKAAESGKKLTPAAAELLLTRAGTDMEVLRQELDKALLYCLDRERVDAPDLERLVGKSREDAVWEISDAVRAKDARRALTLCEDMLAAGTFPLVLLALLVRQARHLLQARLLWEKAGRPQFRDFRSFQSRLAGAWESGRFGKGADDVTTIHPFASFKRFDAARHYSLGQLRAMLARLRRAERDLKTGAVAGPREALEELLLDLCLAGREAA